MLHFLLILKRLRGGFLHLSAITDTVNIWVFKTKFCSSLVNPYRNGFERFTSLLQTPGTLELTAQNVTAGTGNIKSTLHKSDTSDVRENSKIFTADTRNIENIELTAQIFTADTRNIELTAQIFTADTID